MKDAAAPGPPLETASLALAVPDPAVAPVGQPVPVGIAGPSPDASATLPRDHPAWQRDVLAVSARVRAVLAHVRPAVVRVLTFWDHAVRRISVGGRHLEVDVSGCYRIR